MGGAYGIYVTQDWSLPLAGGIRVRWDGWTLCGVELVSHAKQERKI